MDRYAVMPEVPPFPFNPAGTLYMCPPTLTSNLRANRYNLSTFQQSYRRFENENLVNNNNTYHSMIDKTIDSLSTSSKDTSIINSTAISSCEENQPLHRQNISTMIDEMQTCSIANAPLTLITLDDERERSSNAENLPSNECHEEQLTNDKNEQLVDNVKSNEEKQKQNE